MQTGRKWCVLGRTKKAENNGATPLRDRVIWDVEIRSMAKENRQPRQFVENKRMLGCCNRTACSKHRLSPSIRHICVWQCHVAIYTTTSRPSIHRTSMLFFFSVLNLVSNRFFTLWEISRRIYTLGHFKILYYVYEARPKINRTKKREQTQSSYFSMYVPLSFILRR